jgi:hypothetical protein
MMRVLLCFSLFVILLQAERAIGADFSKQKQFWIDHKFVCQSDAGDFPSKEGDGRDPCDDGDMTLFNPHSPDDAPISATAAAIQI